MKEFELQEFLKSEFFFDIKVLLTCAKAHMDNILFWGDNVYFCRFFAEAIGVARACSYVYRNCNIAIEADMKTGTLYVKYRSGENEAWEVIAEIAEI